MCSPPEENAVLGTCSDMCPIAERVQRERERRLHRFEQTPAPQAGFGDRDSPNPVGGRRADPLRIVKEYSRPAAGKGSTRPEDLRVAPTLMRTVDYLLDEVVSRTDASFPEVYDFVSDRLRAVRQDLVIQRLSGRDRLPILEKSARFLLVAGYLLDCESPSPEHTHLDGKLNEQQTQETLSRLLHSLDEHDVMSAGEWHAIYLLYNLGSFFALQSMLKLRPQARDRPVLKMAWEINRAFMESNYVRLFRLALRLPFLHSCALHRHIAALRAAAVHRYKSAFASRNCSLPLDKLVEWLALDGVAQGVALCCHFGLALSADDRTVTFSRKYVRDGPPSPSLSSAAKLVGKKQGSTCLHKFQRS
uniref:SAC3/GANP/THP3 conserved domain-containing protein n=1 Tax=Eptatretus burgeri TaxID=7764 RepID=A0A8C4Q7N5_EPTBU